MTVSYFVAYQGSAQDLPGFIARYRTTHAATLRQWPGLRGLRVHVPVDWHDPFPVNAGGLALLAQLQFDSVAALDWALRSDARAAAREDFRRFPPFTGQVFHQAMAEEILF